MLGKGGVNSGPGGHGVLEMTQTDGPGFSLCATPLESSCPGFRGVGRGWMNEQRSRCIPDQSCQRELRGWGEESRSYTLVGDGVAK